MTRPQMISGIICQLALASVLTSGEEAADWKNTKVTAEQVKSGHYIAVEGDADNITLFKVVEPARLKVDVDEWQKGRETVYKNAVKAWGTAYASKKPETDRLVMQRRTSKGQAYYVLNSDDDIKEHEFKRARLVSHTGQYKNIYLGECNIPVGTPGVKPDKPKK